MFVIALIIGIPAVLLFVFFPLYGPAAAGFIAGLIAGGLEAGAWAGLLSGVAGGVLFTGGAPGSGTVIRKITTILHEPVLHGILGVVLNGGTLFAVVYFGLLGMLGGAAGGLVRRKKKRK
ncbi:hypothetical protein [Desulfotomaculum copahuensis]|uniref:Uncharacterized protein n=1 Tax=Desulfotomaculum copahuensis TaxID=1838280 RepID=A0A1B7LEM7_9FIRM|nr:hypothetical protein [Desulfotomaculum copahuensis]OAT81696.1 hypothetical protein A6M21_09795 [Desulfotomaculum copahuensis]